MCWRGYRNSLQIDFDGAFTVIDGRNGSGKSSICDAVEFALTGQISKYAEASADGETTADYVWWRGEEPAKDNFVQLGFRDRDGENHRIRRSRSTEECEGLAAITDLLIDPAVAPPDPFRQLCQTLVIRDEFISRLSLELTESKRFQFLREALGSIKAEEEIRRAHQLQQMGKKRLDDAKNAVEHARLRLTNATRRTDEARTTLANDSSLTAAASALNSVLEIEHPLEELASVARPIVASLRDRIEGLGTLKNLQLTLAADTQRLSDISIEREADVQRRNDAGLLLTAEAGTSSAQGEEIQHSQQMASLLSELTELGEQLGLNGDQCPLCGAVHTLDTFAHGLASARNRAQQLDAHFAALARARRSVDEIDKNSRQYRVNWMQ